LSSRSAPSLQEIDLVFHALSHEARRNVVLILSHFGGELPSGYLARRFQHSWPTTTRHLGVLERAKIVEVRREGRNSHYRLNRDRIEWVLQTWLDNLTPPTPTQRWSATGPKTVRDLKPRATHRKGPTTP
jgi:DNA-binding transcriptional ArsR family regulator